MQRCTSGGMRMRVVCKGNLLAITFGLTLVNLTKFSDLAASSSFICLKNGLTLMITIGLSSR